MWEQEVMGPRVSDAAGERCFLLQQSVCVSPFLLLLL